MSPEQRPTPPAFAGPLKRLDDVLRGLRTGRATPALIEGLPLEAYGGVRMALGSLSSISTVDPRTLQVEPWDKTLLKDVEKCIAASPLGVNPVTAGSVIRVPFPPLSEERRRELGKLVRQYVEEAKVAIRQIREKLLKDLRAQQAAGALSEDAGARERKTLQADVDAAVAKAEERAQEKEAELLSV